MCVSSGATPPRERIAEYIKRALFHYGAEVSFEDDIPAGMVSIAVTGGLMNVRVGWLAASVENNPNFVAWCMTEAWRMKYGAGTD